jgi:hypothetical protein
MRVIANWRRAWEVTGDPARKQPSRTFTCPRLLSGSFFGMVMTIFMTGRRDDDSLGQVDLTLSATAINHLRLQGKSAAIEPIEPETIYG